MHQRVLMLFVIFTMFFGGGIIPTYIWMTDLGLVNTRLFMIISGAVGMSNVILTPHAAWGAYESRVRCIETISDNIDAFISAKKINRVDI